MAKATAVRKKRKLSSVLQNVMNRQKKRTVQEKKTKTSITIKYDVGFSNALYIRGNGCDLSWEKGKMLKNVSADEWVWETDKSFGQCEFKVLINDQVYENGENRRISCGSSVSYTPQF